MKFLLLLLICASTAFAEPDSITVSVDANGWSVEDRAIRTQIELLTLLDSQTKNNKDTLIKVSTSPSVKYTRIKDTLEALGYAKYWNVTVLNSSKG